MQADRDESLTLEILCAIEADQSVTQRRLASQLGVALGLTNAYLRRCVRKGLVKMAEAPANRYIYYLTPKGFAEKSRLTAEFLSASLGFYRRASDSMAAVFDACRARGLRTVCLAGARELAEIASVRAQDSGVDIVGRYAPGTGEGRFLARPVFEHLADVPACDAAVFVAMQPAPALYAELCERWGADRVLVPGVVALFAHDAAEPPGTAG